MKKYLIIALVLLVAVGIAYWLFARQQSAGSANTGTSTPITLPAAGQAPVGTYVPPGTELAATSTAPDTTEVALRAGGSVVVNDFLHNGTTISDPENTGNYYLAGSVGYCLKDGSCPSGAKADNYIVIYDSAHQFFTIALTAEPIGPARLAAEAFLRTTLGLSNEQLCGLNYYIGTTESVNNSYSGKNLGFSACAGATSLPNQ